MYESRSPAGSLWFRCRLPCRVSAVRGRRLPAAGPPRQLTTAGKKDKHPRWSPDGQHILFESNRSGDFQLWVISVAGGEAKQLTSIATEAGTGIWSPDGKWIAFVSTVYPEFS